MGVELWNGREGTLVAQCPVGGALLHEQWAVSEYSAVTWFPDEDSAMARLREIAKGRPIDETRWVDLTQSQIESSAWIVLVPAGERGYTNRDMERWAKEGARETEARKAKIQRVAKDIGDRLDDFRAHSYGLGRTGAEAYDRDGAEAQILALVAARHQQ